MTVHQQTSLKKAYSVRSPVRMGSTETTMPGCLHWHARSSYFETQTEIQTDRQGTPLLLSTPPPLPSVCGTSETCLPEKSRDVPRSRGVPS